MTATRDRTPLVLGIIAGVLLIAVIITLAIALNRPGPQAPAAPDDASSPPAADQSPEVPDAEDPTETDAPAPTGVELTARGFTVRDDAGLEVAAYGWSDDIQTAVTALSAAFGAQPTERTEAGNGTTYPDYTVYQWPGFALYDMVPLPDGPSRDEYSQPSYLRYTANTVGGVAITAEFGLEIGMPVDAVRAIGPDREQERGSGIRFVFAADRSANVGGEPTYSAIVDTDGTAVTAILAFYYSGG